MSYAKTAPFWRRVWYTPLRDAIRGRFDARLDWPQLVASADLPIEMADTIRQTVRRTRLWRTEKVDIARELIAHFQDGLSTGRTPQQLMQAFGDAKQAARLMRRAKKRARPTPWHVLRWSLWTMEFFACVYVLMGFYLLPGRPSITTDYLANINARAFAVPDAERAWPLYREAILEMDGQFSQDYESNPFVLAGNVRPSDEKWPDAESFVVKHATAIAKLRAAGQRESLGLTVSTNMESFAPEDSVFFIGNAAADRLAATNRAKDPTDGMLISTLLPHFGFLRNASRVLATDCRRASRANDGQAALQDVRAILGVSRHFQESPLLISSLAVSSIQGMALSAVQEMLSQNADLWSNEQLRDLAHLIARSDIDWSRAIDGEKAMFYDILQRVYTDDGNGDGRLTIDGMRLLENISRFPDGNNFRHRSWLASTGIPYVDLPAANLLVASRAEMAARYERYMDSAARRLHTPIWEWRESDLDPSVTNPEQLSGSYYVLVGLTAPATESMSMAAEARRGERDGALIGIALEMYRREKGDWPKNLDELSPRWLPKLPVDRFTGQPLKYQLIDGEPVVYSVGEDKDDDGGKLPTLDPNRAPTPYLFGGPAWFNGRPGDHASNDGDWLIWTTQNIKEPAADRD